MNIKNFFYRLPEHLAVILFFIFLTLIFTYPLITVFTSNVPGEFDVYWFLWELWHFKLTLAQGANPLFSNMLFYPTGAPLYFAATPIQSLIAVPLQDIFGLFGAYNSLYMLSYILSGYTMYLLAKHITKDWKSALIAGAIFSFCPYHSTHAIRHLNLMAIQFIPLFFLFYLKLKEKVNFANSVLAGFFFALVAYSEMVYFMMCALFVIFDSALTVFSNPNRMKEMVSLLQKMFLFFICTVVFISPYIYNLLAQVLFSNYVASAEIDFLMGYSPDILSFLVPSKFNPILSSTFVSIYPILEHHLSNVGIEGTIFFGFTILAFVIYAIFKVKGKEVEYWTKVLIAAFVMMFCFIWIYGVPIFIFPFYVIFFYLFPFFSFMRVPARFDIILVLCSAILFAIAFSHIRKTMKSKVISEFLFPIAVLLLIFLEFYSPPQAYLNLGVNPFYYELGKDNQSYAILDIPTYPCSFSDYGVSIMYAQIFHKKPMVSGQLSRYPTSICDFFDRPCFSNLVTMSNISKCAPKQYDESIPNGVKLIVIHKNIPKMMFYPYANISETTPLLQSLYGIPVYEDKELIVYERKDYGQ